jgi:hypothetical protein
MPRFCVATLSVLTCRRYAFVRNLIDSTYRVVGEKGNVVEDELVGVSKHEVLLLAGLVGNGTDHLDAVEVFELGGLAEVLSLFRILVFLCH